MPGFNSLNKCFNICPISTVHKIINTINFEWVTLIILGSTCSVQYNVYTDVMRSDSVRYFGGMIAALLG